MYKLKILSLSIILLMILSLVSSPPPIAHAQASAFVNLLSLSNYTALAATGATAGAVGTNLNGGNLGIRDAATCTGFPLIDGCSGGGAAGTIAGGVILEGGAVPLASLVDVTAVLVDLNGRAPTAAIGAGGLNAGGGLTLTQGVYDVTSAVTDLTGPLTLNGDANSVFIFRFNSSFITSGAANILFTGGARNCNVYWVVPTQATFDGATQMAGTVFAGTAVAFTGGGAVVNGRVIARTADIAFNNTTINNIPVCAAVTPPTGGGEEEEEGGGRRVGGLPNTGGAPIRNDEFPWSLVVVGGLGAIALGLGVRSYRRRTH